MAKRNLTSALLVDWRAQLPRGSEKARGAWRVIQSAQVINWRAQLGPSSSGGGAAGIAIAGEADGEGSAYVAIVGPPQDCGGEADGVSGPQCSLRVGQTIRGEADGAGNAQCFLGGGLVSIACLTSGSVGGSPPTPQSTVLFDAPSSW
jgi:hypothetical protein